MSVKGALDTWMTKAHQLECDARAARLEADTKPSIAVGDLITHNGETYEVTARKLEISKRAGL